jgi:hypothetical protein
MVFMGDGTGVDMANITRGGPAACLLKALCHERQWVHDITKEAPMTHGLHLRNVPRHAAAVQVDVVTSTADMRDGLERLLSIFAAVRHSPARSDAAAFTFLRAMTRAMAKNDGIVLAHINTDGVSAGALALRQGHQSWILYLEGPDDGDPCVQAILCDAIGKAAGAAPFSLVKPRLTGLACAPLTTESWNITKARHRPPGRSIILTARRVAASIL